MYLATYRSFKAYVEDLRKDCHYNAPKQKEFVPQLCTKARHVAYS